MTTDITPADSVCPIYIVAADPKQVAADLAEAEAQAEAKAAKAAARQKVLDKLGLTANEAAAFLG